VRLARSTIVGEEAWGDGDQELFAGYLRILSRAFAMPYLSGVFAARGDGAFSLAELESVPDLSIPGCQEAIVEYFACAS
jgi:hypothetical protein